jgi:hypothetical protein
VRWTESTVLAHKVQGLSLNAVVHPVIYGLDLINRRGMRWSNLDHWFKTGWLGLDWGEAVTEWLGRAAVHHSHQLSSPELASERTGTQRPRVSSSKRSAWQGSLTACWVPRWLMAAAWSSWSSMVAHDLDCASLASRSSSKALPWSPQAPRRTGTIYRAFCTEP